MSLAHARLVDALGSVDGGTLSAELRANASEIFNASLTFQWQQSDGGAWRCLYPNGSYTGASPDMCRASFGHVSFVFLRSISPFAYRYSVPAAVRSVNDYVYIAQALGLLGRSNESFYALPAAVADASIEFFSNELLSQGTAWVRALSLEVRTLIVLQNCKEAIVLMITLQA